MLPKEKPLSPHLQIYKPQLTSFTSILHRITGIFLYLGTLVICYSIVKCAYQVDSMALAEKRSDIWQEALKYLSYSLLIGWTFSLYYHLLNGIRHLLWDIGKGFEVKTAARNALLVLILSSAMTLASIGFASSALLAN